MSSSFDGLRLLVNDRWAKVGTDSLSFLRDVQGHVTLKRVEGNAISQEIGPLRQAWLAAQQQEQDAQTIDQVRVSDIGEQTRQLQTQQPNQVQIDQQNAQELQRVQDLVDHVIQAAIGVENDQQEPDSQKQNAVPGLTVDTNLALDEDAPVTVVSAKPKGDSVDDSPAVVRDPDITNAKLADFFRQYDMVVVDGVEPGFPVDDNDSDQKRDVVVEKGVLVTPGLNRHCNKILIALAVAVVGVVYNYFYQNTKV